LEAIKPSPSAPARKPLLTRAYLRAQARSRGAQPNPREKPTPSIRLQNLKNPRQTPEAKTHPTRSPSTLPVTRRQRDRAAASIGSDQTSPQRVSAKVPPPPELTCERRPAPAEPNPTPEKSPPHPSVLRILKTQDKPPK
jgi:hypothetical protein